MGVTTSDKREHTLPSGEPRPRYDLEKLLSVAVDVFSQRGYDVTSIENLSRASGLSKSSIYHHVDSKEHLLRLALERALDPLLAMTRDPEALSGRALDRLQFVIRGVVQLLSDRLPYVTLLLRVHGNTQTEIWALRERRAFDAFASDLVQQAIDEGDLRSDLDSLVTARLIFGMINSLIEWHNPAREPNAQALATRVIELVFDGVRIPNATPSSVQRLN